MANTEGSLAEAARRLRDIAHRYKDKNATLRYEEMYRGVPQGNVLAYFHESLDKHFTTINKCAKTNGHFWAANSVALLDLMETIEEDLDSLQRAAVSVVLTDTYQQQIDYLAEWVSHSGGSPIPSDFTPLEVSRYAPVFVSRDDTTITVRSADEKVDLKPVGEGSYAIVFSYVDPKYGKKFAVKRAKRSSSPRDLELFKREFTKLSELSFPHVVEVYRYDDEQNEYTMEYCDTNVRDYIRKHNNTLQFHVRRTLALQCLYGLNYLHQSGVLHRDVSPQNVLLSAPRQGGVLGEDRRLGAAQRSQPRLYEEPNRASRDSTRPSTGVNGGLPHRTRDVVRSLSPRQRCLRTTPRTRRPPCPTVRA